MKKNISLFIILIIVFLVSALLLRSLAPKQVSARMLLMGAMGRISIVTDKSTDVSAARDFIDQSFDIMKEYEKRCDYYSDNSELNRINSKACLSEVKVTKDIFEVVEKALEFSKLTGQVFDVTATSLHKLGGHDNIVLNKEKRTVFIKDKETKIDLGGIATGFAIDKAVEFLDSHNVNNYLIDIGGDIYAKGKNRHGQPWEIGIRDPQDQDNILKAISIEGLAVTTSGNYVKKHIIDTESGKLADSGLKSTTVIAQTCTEADVLATSFFIMGKDKTERFVDSYDKYLEVYFVEVKDGKAFLESYSNKDKVKKM